MIEPAIGCCGLPAAADAFSVLVRGRPVSVRTELDIRNGCPGCSIFWQWEQRNQRTSLWPFARQTTKVHSTALQSSLPDTVGRSRSRIRPQSVTANTGTKFATAKLLLHPNKAW